MTIPMTILISTIYREVPPPPDLAGPVRCLWWHYRIDTGSPAGHVAMPDVSSDLVLAAEVVSGTPLTGNLILKNSTLSWVGPLSRAVTYPPRAATLAVGVRFAPWGAAEFLASPMEELADRSLDAEAVHGRPGVELRRRLTDATSIGEIIELCLLSLRRSLARRPRDATLLQGAWLGLSRAVGAGESLRVGHLAEALGVGERRLRRVFARQVGLSPQETQGILRFHRLLRELRSGRPRWAELALSCGYYDQAHMINDVRRLTGLSPSRLCN